MRTLAVALLLSLTISYALADDNYISPFSLEYDTLTQQTLRNFLLLPKIPDADIPALNCGTKKEAENIARNAVMKWSICGYLGLGTEKPKKTLGTHTVELYGPATISGKRYFWIVKGMLNHYYTRKGAVPHGGFNHHYTYVFYFDNATPRLVFYLIQNVLQYSNTDNDHALATIADPIRREKEQLAHDIAIKKEKWTHKDKVIEGKLEGYKNERVTFKLKAGTTRNVKAAELSNEDQEILRGYIDFLQIPVR